MKTFKQFLFEEAELNSVKEYVDYIEEGYDEIVNKYKSHITDSDSVPSAPDTSKFRATRGGMLETAHNVNVHGGQYGADKFFPIAVKVGGRIDRDVHEDIKDEVEDQWEGILEGARDHEPHVVDGKVIKTKEGNLSFSSTGGTNWSAYGIVLRK